MRGDFLRANLCFMHGIMTASENLLRWAIRKGAVDDLGLYFTHHLTEERGHVEMLEADLKRLGVTRIIRFPLAAQLAGAQYYYIEHEHPAMLLGYMAALESHPLSLADVDALEAKHGPLTCVRHHAIHDPDHARELRYRINQLAEPLLTRVLENEAWTEHELYKRAVSDIEAAASQHFKAVA